MPAKKIIDIEKLKKDYSCGKSLNSLQVEYKCTRPTLSKYLKQAGVEVESNNYRYNYNTELFKCVDDEQQAYWLGFLYADGYVQKRKRIELALGIKDIKHLEKYRDFVCPELPIGTRKISVRGKQFLCARVIVFNKYLHANIISLGCANAKSKTLTFPGVSQVPEGLLNHFIRGYFDGDGSVNLNAFTNNLHMTVAGTESFLNGLNTVLFQNIPNYTLTKLHKPINCEIYVLQKGGNNQIKGVYDYMYKDATVFLERKKEIFSKFYNKQSCRSVE
jgi:intein-encoded DNA endonuclease-like protein